MIKKDYVAIGTCEHCGKDTRVKGSLEIEDTIPPARQVQIESGSNTIQTVIEKPMEHSHDETQEERHEKASRSMPKGTNYMPCIGCDKKLKNPKQTTKFDTCSDCGANTVPRNSEICPTCGSKRKEDWDESEVKLKSEEEDEEE